MGRKEASVVEIENPQVAEKFDTYPEPMRERLLFLRQLILESAAEMDDIGEVEETLKWGEPSYLTKPGSTIRIDWKESAPEQYAIYFHCRTTLIETYRELYGDQFSFDGNRAIIFGEGDEIPIDALKHCISLALVYHRVKHLPLLGV